MYSSKTKISKFFSLVEPYKKELVLVLVLTLISLIFELLSLGIFIPIINIIQSTNGINNLPYLEFLPNQVLTFDKFKLLLFFLVIVFFIYLLKTIINISTSIFHAILASKIDTYLSVKIFKSLIQKPYENHSNKNTSSFISTIINEVHQFSELIKYVLTFIVELLVSVGIFVGLIIYNPISTLLIILFSALFFLLMRRITKYRIIFWGEQRQKFQDLMYKNLKEGFNSIIYIKLKKIESYFISSFKKSIETRNIYTTRQYAFSNIPRQLLELASIFLLGLVVYTNINLFKVNFETLVLMLTFYVIALSRILPSINRIITSYNFILYSNVVIDKVYNEAFQSNYNKPRPLKNVIKHFSRNIQLKNISFKYKGSKKFILNNINLSINKNEIFGIKGLSGSGKTTLVNLLLGLLNTTEGEIFIDNKIITSNDTFNQLASYVPQNTLILDDSLKNNIAFGNNLNQLDLDWMRECICTVELSDFVKNLDNGLETILGEDGSKISGGQKQRIGLARALYSKPKIIVLDEATNALDKETEASILQTIKKLSYKITFIIISHNEKVIEISDQIYEM